MIADLKFVKIRQMALFSMVLSVSTWWVFAPPIVSADVEWTFGKQRNLDVSPSDISSSSDGQWIYILTPGEVAIFSVLDDKVVSRVPVDKAFDKITSVAQTNTLIVSSSTGKTFKLIQLEFIQKFAYDGLAFKGLENAPVTIAVFSDYQWPFCARLDPLLQQVLEKYPQDVKLVEKNFPLQMHKMARTAAAAALAAHNQGKFWPYHYKIFENMSGLNDAKFLDIAKELGLDIDKFSKDMASPAVQNIINRDLMEGNQARVTGTPTIFVNGKQLKDRSMQGFQNMIDAELRKKKQ